MLVSPVTIVVWIALWTGALYWRRSHRDGGWDLASALETMQSMLFVMLALVFLMAFFDAPEFFFRVLTKVFGD